MIVKMSFNGGAFNLCHKSGQEQHVQNLRRYTKSSTDCLIIVTINKTFNP